MQKNLTRAERDNDLIYHQDVPPLSSLHPIVAFSLVDAMVPSALTEPKAALGDDAVIFGELVGYGARVAIGRRLKSKVFMLTTDTRGTRNLQGASEDLDTGGGRGPCSTA